MLKLAFFFAAAVAVGASAAHGEHRTFAPLPSGQVEFTMPSGNIGCIFTPEGGTSAYMPADGGPELLCDRVEPDYRRFVLGRSGPATENGDVLDASCCSAINAFAYGDSWAMGGFSCASTPSGLSCIRGANGFFISRSRTSVW
jgi:hypothetical protein